MHPTYSLLERHVETINESVVHWFDAPDQTLLIKPTDKQFNLLWSKENNAIESQVRWPTAALNILFFPKAKDRLDWWLRQLTEALSESQKLWVVGENNGGIKSLPKRVKAFFECVKLDSARHCALYELVPIQPMPKQNDWRVFSTHELECHAMPGVFSAGRLDKGTEVLFSALPKLAGSGLEFGGGCGVLTAVVANMSTVDHVTSVEIDLLAARSSQRTFEQNQLQDKATVIWSSGTENLPASKFDFIVSNPPFHQGIKTAYEPTERFFAEAHQWLKRGGKFVWVANDFLNYQQLLEANFTKISLLKHERGFKVLSAIRK